MVFLDVIVVQQYSLNFIFVSDFAVVYGYNFMFNILTFRLRETICSIFPSI